MHNRTNIHLLIWRVILTSSDDSHTVRLLFDPNSPNQLSTKIYDDTIVSTLNLKYPSAQSSFTNEFGELPEKSSATWILVNKLHDLIRFEPACMQLIMEYKNSTNEVKVLKLKASGFMEESIPKYANS